MPANQPVDVDPKTDASATRKDGRNESAGALTRMGTPPRPASLVT